MMLKHPQDVYHHRSSTSDFLFNQADAFLPDQGIDETGLKALEQLTAVFPKILTGQAFIESVTPRMASSDAFTVMIIRMDAAASECEPAPARADLEELVHVARAVDAVCQTRTDIWGRLNYNTFAAFFPEKDSADRLEPAGQIRNHLSEFSHQTVSIGIASYPTVNFSKDHVLENAGKALDHAAFFGPDATVIFDSVSLNISGDKFYQNGNIHAAIEEYNTALLMDPSNINVRNSLGVCYGVLNQPDQALKEFEEAIRINPQEVMPIYNAGLIHMLNNDKDQALKYYFEAEKRMADIFEIKFQIGRLYLETGHPEKAADYLFKAVELKPESAPAYRYLGESYMAMGLTEEALSAFKKAIRINPNDSDSLSAIGYLFDVKGENLDIAVMFCRNSIELSPANGLFRYRLGRLYLKQKSFRDALAEFEAAGKLGYDASDDIRKLQEQLLSTRNPDSFHAKTPRRNK